jgi:magnesium transporter
MLSCYFRKEHRYAVVSTLEECAQVEQDQVVWLDLHNSNREERDFVEQHFGVELFTRQEAEEIESSSKYFESEKEINANVNYIFQKDPENYALDPVSFILKDKLLVTQRNIPLKSFDDVRRQFLLSRRTKLTGANVLISLMETRIDIEADFLEDLSKKIYSTARKLALDEDIEEDEDVLIKIYHFQEINILFRESNSELKRLFSSILRSEFFPRDLREKVRVLIKDADSLLGHTSFHFERLEYIQNTFLGLIDMKQNQIIKLFTVVVTPARKLQWKYAIRWPWG